jgi:D-3-phosphoglycerate dehydrogenase / 2-oxoglutarate reductase
MKDGGMLINCARAGVLNEDDLRAIKAEKSLVFCNDVYAKDAEGEKSVKDIADVMLPHLGASTKEANFNAAKRAAEQTLAYFEKGVTACVVNKAVPDGLDEQYQSLAHILADIASSYLGSKPPHKIETSFYGELNKYGKWMLSPITAGICSEFDPFLDAADAESFLTERGIEVEDRPVDEGKKYGQSITIDLFEGSDTINKVSIRGTIAEGKLMISRINDFQNLYLEPTGHNLFVGYSDAPGVIGKIASILGENNINIIDLRAPQDLKLGKSLAAIKTNTPVNDDVLAQIKTAVNACVAFVYSYE